MAQDVNSPEFGRRVDQLSDMGRREIAEAVEARRLADLESDARRRTRLTMRSLGDGTTRLHAQSLCDSFEARDGWLASGMEVGVNEGYATLDKLIAEGEV